MKPHRSDPVSLTFGLVFLAIVGLWLARRVLDVVVPRPELVVAGILILFGVAGLLGTLRTGRSRPAVASAPPAVDELEDES